MTKPSPPPHVPDEERPALQNLTVEIVCNLEQIMKKRRITQQQLSQSTKIGAGAIRNLRQNTAQKIDLGTVAAIAQFLGIESMDDLFTIVYKNNN
ncbi:helix-turn-helix transcriptional regulator [Laspinema sp. D1]|jgi:DNA-binding Xre family transcriptional regulator|uniref:helix-turn-helix domain-containing protein n=1 Tax=Laspinema palackyanum TaxID=3231601 RepID=UPI00346B183E|nr:helix-turn-helix transcriptional regulator [Laspinema sp. D2b]